MDLVLEWLNLVLKKPQFVNRIGRVKFAEKPIFYLLPEPKEESKEPIFNLETKVKAQKDANKKKGEEQIDLFLVENFNKLLKMKVKVPSNLGCQTITAPTKSQIENE